VRDTAYSLGELKARAVAEVRPRIFLREAGTDIGLASPRTV